MKIPDIFMDRLLGTMKACYSGSFQGLEEFASHLERIAADARNLSAHIKARDNVFRSNEPG
jgi:hypothetical protein